MKVKQGNEDPDKWDQYGRPMGAENSGKASLTVQQNEDPPPVLYSHDGTPLTRRRDIGFKP